MLIYIAVIAAIIAAIIVIWELTFNKNESFIVEYSELVGDVEVIHPKFYKGKVSKDRTSYKIGDLKIERPYLCMAVSLTARRED